RNAHGWSKGRSRDQSRPGTYGGDWTQGRGESAEATSEDQKTITERSSAAWRSIFEASRGTTTSSTRGSATPAVSARCPGRWRRKRKRGRRLRCLSTV